jgi:hypothetical protein
MFYFQQLFNTAMSGIDSRRLQPAWCVKSQIRSLLASLYLRHGFGNAVETHAELPLWGAAAVRFFAVGPVMVNYGHHLRTSTACSTMSQSFIHHQHRGGSDVFGQVDGARSVHPLN